MNNYQLRKLRGGGGGGGSPPADNDEAGPSQQKNSHDSSNDDIPLMHVAGNDPLLPERWGWTKTAALGFDRILITIFW